MTDCIDHLHAELVALFVQCVCCCVLLCVAVDLVGLQVGAVASLSGSR